MGMIVWHMVPIDDAPPAGGALDLATCVIDGSSTTVASVAFGGDGTAYRADGLEMWISFRAAGIVRGYDLSTPFETPGGSLSDNGNNLTIATANDIFFSNDGLHFMVCTSGTYRMYTLSTPWLMSSAVETSTFGIANEVGTITWDGLTIYAVSATNTVKKYDLSVAWDVSTAVDSGLDFILGGPTPTGMAVSQDETRYYLTDGPTDDVLEYIMSTPGDPTSSTLNYTLVDPLTVQLAGISVSYDQTRLLLSGARAAPDQVNVISYTGDAV